jgi:hypothetical protein
MRGGGGGGGDITEDIGGGGGAGDMAFSINPQEGQNFAPGLIGAPHAEQTFSPSVMDEYYSFTSLDYIIIMIFTR